MIYSNRKITKLIIPLAGFGARFLPSSSAYPKELTHLVDKPVLQYLVEEAYASGIREIIFIINSEKDIISKYFSEKYHNKYVKKTFFDSTSIPEEYIRFRSLIKKIKFHTIKKNATLGDGHSILFARRFISPNETFVVSMGDLIGFDNKPFIQQLIKVYYNNNNTPVISVEKVPIEATSRFGVIKPGKSKDRLHTVVDLIEKPGPLLAPSRLILTGKYVLTTKIFDYLQDMVKNHKEGEIKLVNALEKYSKENDLLAYECLGKIQDTGNKLDFLKAVVVFGISHPKLGRPFKKFIKTL